MKRKGKFVQKGQKFFDTTKATPAGFFFVAFVPFVVQFGSFVSGIRVAWFGIKSYRRSLVILFFCFANESAAQTYSFPWLKDAVEQTAIQELETPDGYERVSAAPNTFADWLRNLPLKKDNNVVCLFNGSRKPNQTAHHRVLAVDVGNENLQQCADAVMRLRAEYLFGQGQADEIAFNFTSGSRAACKAWRQGYRPRVQGRKVTWQLSAPADSSYENFRAYLQTVFTYAGSASLNLEMKPVSALAQIQIGDVFIKGGYPGHAVIVVDLAVDPNSNKKAILLAQSYMPAQEIHVLKNPRDEKMSPWYVVNGEDKLYTPEWTFDWSELRRF